MSISDAIETVRRELGPRPGRVFYASRAAFERPSELYMLGFNPGGPPAATVDGSIGHSLDAWSLHPPGWSAYVAESWAGKVAGRSPLQRRVRHLFDSLGLDVHATPASNVVFAQSSREAHLAPAEKASLLSTCWRVHEAVIEQLGVRTILCFGTTAGRWCRAKLGANRLFDCFREQNLRRWRSSAHLASDGRAVVTLTHPSTAHWCVAPTDPSPLVRAVLARDQRFPHEMPLMLPESGDTPLVASNVPGSEASWKEIEDFALLYDGYAAHDSLDACAAIANARQNRSIDHLRTCLFFEQRRWRHAGGDPDPETMEYIRSLLAQLRVKLAALR